MSEGLRHTYLTGPWHYCGICDEKTKIADMTWQLGVLRCPTCVDKEILGEREKKIEAVLTDGKEELAPPEKLRDPSENTQEVEILL